MARSRKTKTAVPPGLSEHHYRQVFENMHDAVLIVDSDDQIIMDANPRACKVFGYTRKEFIGKNADILYPERPDSIYQKYLLRTLDETGRFQSNLLLNRRKNGTLFPSEIFIRRFKHDGKTHSFGIIRDISEQERTNEIFRILFEEAADAIYLAGPRGRFVDANRKTLQVLGHTKKSLRRLGVRDILSGGFPRTLSHSEWIKRALETPPDMFHHHRSDGSTVPVEVRIRPIRFGGALCHLFHVRDISGRHEVEQKLLRQHRELREEKEFLDLIQEGATDAFLLLDRKEKIVSANSAAADLFGLSKKTLQGKTIRSFLPAQEQKKLPDFRERLRGGEHLRFRINARDVHRQDLMLDAGAAPIRRENQLFIFVTLRDVSEQERTYQELLDRETRLQAIINSSEDMIFIRDRKGRYLLANPVVERIVKRPLSRILGRTDRELLSAQDAKEVRKTDLRVMRTGRSCTFEFMRTVDGKERYFTSTKVPYRDHDGNIIGVIGIAVETTLRRKAEMALRESEDRWRSLVTNAPDFIFMIDPKGKIRFINRTYPELPEKKALGSSFANYLPPPFRKPARDAIRSVFRTGRPATFETPGPGPRNTSRWYSCHVGPVREKKEIASVLLIAADIDDRKRAEEALWDSMTRTANLLDERDILLEHSLDFLYRHDTEGIFTYLSPSIRSITGHSPKEWLAHYEKFMTDSPINEKVYENTERTLRTGRQSPPYLVEVRHKKGHNILLEVNEQAYREKGRIAGIIGVARDVTEREEARKEIQEAYEELQSANARLKEAQQELVRTEKLASIGVVMSGIAHEINNPLNVIYGNLRLLKEGCTALLKAARERRTPPENEMERLGQMISAALSSAEHSRVVMEEFRQLARDPSHAGFISLKETIEAAIGETAPHVRGRIRIIRRIGPLPRIRAFPGPLRRTISNLLRNAAESIRGKGRITLTAGKEKGGVRIRITDTGAGFHEKDKDRIFEPFFTTKRRGEGFGLGLALCHAVIQNHRGTIEASSNRGKGTTFTIHLPVG